MFRIPSWWLGALRACPTLHTTSTGKPSLIMVSLTIVGTNIKKQQIRRSDLLKVKVGF